MVDFSLDIPAPQEDEEKVTDGQKGYIRDLMRKTGSSGLPEGTLNDLGTWQASSIIDQLLDLKDTLSGDSSKFDESKFTGLDAGNQTKFRYIVWALLAALIVLIIVLSNVAQTVQ